MKRGGISKYEVSLNRDIQFEIELRQTSSVTQVELKYGNMEDKKNLTIIPRRRNRLRSHPSSAASYLCYLFILINKRAKAIILGEFHPLSNYLTGSDAELVIAIPQFIKHKYVTIYTCMYCCI